MRTLITGGAGFIGSHVAEQFASNRWTVEIIDDLSTGRRENIAGTVKLHELDVRSEETARLLRAGSYEVVVHLAAQMDVRKSVTDPIFDASSNIVGTLNLLEAIRASGKKTRFVFASSGGAVYGDFVTPPNEETFPKDPESPYAISKLSAEYYLAYYARVHELDTVALRFANVYGPRQDPHGEAGVVAIFCGRILNGKPLTIFGDGQQTRDYVYVGDAARATYAAATRDLPAVGKLDTRGFNIGTGIGTPVTELANILLRVANRRAPIEFAPPRQGEQRHSFVNVAKAEKLLGWKPTMTLEKGLEETFRWFEARATRHPSSLHS